MISERERDYCERVAFEFDGKAVDPDLLALLIRERATVRAEAEVLRKACEKALRYARANGMANWPVFRALCKALKATK